MIIHRLSIVETANQIFYTFSMGFQSCWGPPSDCREPEPALARFSTQEANPAEGSEKCRDDHQSLYVIVAIAEKCSLILVVFMLFFIVHDMF